jgi:hypothetical protein
MALPDYLLSKMFPRINISKINVEGEQDNIDLSMEIEVLEPHKTNQRRQVSSGFYLYSTDEDISLINNLQTEFESAVSTNSIVDFSYYGQIQEKNIEEGNKKFTSRTFFTKVPKYYVDKKNTIILYGSWFRNITTGKLQFSRVQAEILIQNKEIKSESYIYFLQGTEDIWEGEIATIDGGLVFVTDEAIPRQLDRYLVKNYKIQDFRIRSQLQKVVTDFTEINNKIARSTSRQFVREQKKKYFTDLYISQNDQIALLFGINFRDIILENSLLGKDTNVSLEVQNDLFIKSKILELKIVKRRVRTSGKSTSSLTTTKDSVDLFPGSFERMIGNGRDTDSSFSSSETLKENINLFQSMVNKMRFFSCLDTDNSYNQSAQYQYGVKMEIMDGSQKIVLQDMKEMEKTVNDLNIYYNNLSQFILDPTLEGLLYTESEIANVVDVYLKKLSKYYRLDEYVDIKNKLVSSLTPLNLDLASLENFINLCQTFISNLQNIVGDKTIVFDDPHIIEDSIPVENTKNTFSLEYYFTNHIYDTSLTEMKRIQYLPQSGNSFFNEYDFQSINFQNRLTVSKTSSGKMISAEVVPLSISYEETSLVKDGIQKTVFLDTEEQKEQFDKVIRKNLLNHVSINIEKIYLKEISSKQAKEKEIEEDIYNEDIAEIYKYFSSTNVKNKEIDEVIIDYAKYEKDFLARMQFLADYNSFTGQETWLGIERLPSQSTINGQGQILCRLKPKKDYRQTSWAISDNIRLLDTFFVLKVQDVQDLQSSFSSVFSTTYSSSERTTQTQSKQSEESKKIQKTITDAIIDSGNTRKPIQQVDLQQVKIKERIDQSFKKITNSIGNKIING